MTHSDSAGLYPIRTVAQLTGINPITLRAWERRYGLIQPQRTPKGHRLYSETDIQRIHQIFALIDQGIPIGQVKQHLPTTDTKPESEWEEWREAMLLALERFDEGRLDQVYQTALGTYPVNTVTSQLLLPVLQHLGETWQARPGGIAEEHFFSGVIRNKLGARIHHTPLPNHAAKVIIACMPHEQHELGALLFALHCTHNALMPLFFGANLPLKELSAVAHRSQAKAIIISATTTIAQSETWQSLSQLCTDADIPVYVGGNQSVKQLERMRDCGAHPLGSQIEAGLDRLLADLQVS